MLRVHLAGHVEGDWPLAIPLRAGATPPEFVAAAAAENFLGELETTCNILGGARRVLLIGLGDAPDTHVLQAAGATAAAHTLRAPRMTLDLRGFGRRDAVACVAGAVLRAWRYERLRTRAQEDAPLLADLHVVSDADGFARAWARQLAVLRGVAFARDLVTEPANTLTPDGFVERLRDVAVQGLTLEVLRGDAVRAAGLRGLAAVGQGSVHPPALAVLRWPGSFAASPICFVGKGITFDTGGISIKPADGMWDMRADMAGAAACAGAMCALAGRRSAAPAMAVLALAENTTSESAYRPSDVLRHANGTTVEVVDTDAEGRLVLMDALGFAVRQAPAAIVDLATLTGSVVTALGHHTAGLFSNDGALAAAVAAAGAAVGEPVWRLPIDASHRRALDSDIADLRHCSPERGQPDACHAAAFLREFVGEVPWVHLDIAGMETVAEADDRRAAGATGFGVRLLDRLVRDRFEAAR